MVSTTAVIGSTSGLHARPASLFAQAAAKTGHKVTVALGEKSINAASVLGVLTLGASQGDEVELTVEGENEQAVLDELAAMLTTNLDE